MKINAIDHVVLNVTNVERSAEWYIRVLGMTRLDYGKDPNRPRTAVLFGSQRINLRPVNFSKDEWFTADSISAGSQDLCFLTDLKPQEVVKHLHVCGVNIVSGPDLREGAAGLLRSVYCRDPDGSLIEIASYQS